MLTVHQAAQARLSLRPSEFDQKLLENPQWKDVPEPIRILFKYRITVQAVAEAAKDCGVKFEKGRRGYDVWTADSCIHECTTLLEAVNEISSLAIKPDKQYIPQDTRLQKVTT